MEWLVSEHYCPLRVLRSSSSRDLVPLLTSHGRSALGIALENENLGIVQFLISEGMKLSDEPPEYKSIIFDLFTNVLLKLPGDQFEEKT